MNPNEYYSHFPEDKKYFTLIDFFYFLSKHDFKKVVEYVSREVGYSDGVKGVFFPHSFDKWDEEYFEEGILVFVNDKEVNVSYQIFLEYLEIANRLYVEEVAEDTDEMRNILNIISQNAQLSS